MLGSVPVALWAVSQRLWTVASRLGGLVVVVLVVGLLSAAVGISVAPHGNEIVTAFESTPEDVPLSLPEGAERSEMFNVYGNRMTTLADAEEREWVPLGEMTDVVINGILAVEDENFWLHDGVDIRATMRALLSNVSAGGVTQGGSTITQQVIKLVTVRDEQTAERKIEEAILAMRLEDEYTKEEILEYYLNTIFFGNTAYGVQAAAEIYYGKNHFQLDYGDVALLAGLIRSPGAYSFNHPDLDLAKDRRARSLERYVDLGYITEAEADRYDRRPIPAQNLSPRRQQEANGYFAEEVKRTLLDMPELGDTREARTRMVFRGGLSIYTTYDPFLEARAEQAVAEVTPPELLAPLGLAVSLASVDVKTGAVRAMLGGTDFDAEQFNLATQGKRQPGSSFKTYVLTTALDKGRSVDDTISGTSPCAFDQGEGLPPYLVNNFGGSRGRIYTLQAATTASSNCAFVRLGIHTGLEDVAATAADMIGAPEDRFEPFPSMSLGAQELTPLEQAVGYAVLPNDGVRMEPYLIERVEDRNGQVIYQHAPTGRRVVSEEVARNVVSVLEANVRGGTGTGARLASGQRAAGKTGTAQNFEDAWFVGFTPQLSTAVWMGNPEEKVPMRGVGGRSGVTGGSFPASVWKRFMDYALEGAPLEDFSTAPKIGGESEFLFLEDEECTVYFDVPQLGDTPPVQLQRQTSCDLVDYSNGQFSFRPDAICPYEAVLPDGTVETREGRCIDLPELLRPTTTTTSTTSTTSTTRPPRTTTTTTTPPSSTSTTTTTNPPSSSTTSTSTTSTSTTAP